MRRDRCGLESEMASTITSIGSQVVTNVAISTPSPTVDLSNIQPSKTIQNATVSSVNSTTKDTVSFSQEALNLSKDLQDKNKPQDPLAINKQLQEQKLITNSPEKTKEYSVSKSFPPFIGNANELKQLKQSSPALYREILKMIVPPPLDISYYDQQILNGPNIDSSSAN